MDVYCRGDGQRGIIVIARIAAMSGLVLPKFAGAIIMISIMREGAAMFIRSLIQAIVDYWWVPTPWRPQAAKYL
jgi:hypothetical protein